MTTHETAQAARPARVESTGCCPRFDPAPWQGEREVVWHDKLFVKERVRCLLHVPTDMERVVERAYKRIAGADAAPAEHPLFLGEDEASLWHLNLYLEVTKDVPGAEMVRLSGTYRVRVFEGPFRDAPKWMKAVESQLEAEGKTAERMYLAYTTCPRCAKAYGENYVLVYAKVA